jgi:hypothetical protein
LYLVNVIVTVMVYNCLLCRLQYDISSIIHNAFVNFFVFVFVFVFAMYLQAYIATANNPRNPYFVCCVRYSSRKNLALIALVCLVILVVAIVVVVVVAIRKSSAKNRRGTDSDDASAEGVLNNWQQPADPNYSRHVPKIGIFDAADSISSTADRDDVDSHNYNRTFLPLIVEANDDTTTSRGAGVADDANSLAPSESTTASDKAVNHQLRLNKGLSIYPLE